MWKEAGIARPQAEAGGDALVWKEGGIARPQAEAGMGWHAPQMVNRFLNSTARFVKQLFKSNYFFKFIARAEPCGSASRTDKTRISDDLD